MANELRIPKSNIEPLSRFVRMGQAERDALVSALESARPGMDFDGLLEQLDAPEADADLLGMLAGMTLSLNDRPELTAEKFADDLVAAAQKLSDQRVIPAEGNWEPIRSALVRVLQPDGALAYTAKATQVSREYENIFREARILSDIRPIFPRDSKQAKFAVIVHLLRIGFRDTKGQSNRAVFALDRSDLLQLKQLIDRALGKDESLHAIISAAGLRAADPGRRTE